MSILSSPIPLFYWLSFVGIILLQGISGTRSIISTYSVLLEHRVCRSHVQLNFLISALDIGRLFGWFSSTAAYHLPGWMVLLVGLIFGSVGYGVQYLYLIEKISYISYWHVFLLNIIIGYSFWCIDTFCVLIVTRRFKDDQKIVTALTSCYSLLTGKIYTSIVAGIRGTRGFGNSSTYVLLSSLVPLVVGLPVASLFTFPKIIETKKVETFPIVFVSAAATGICILLESTTPPFKYMSPRLRLLIIILAIVLPLALLQVIHKILIMVKKLVIKEIPSTGEDARSKPVDKVLEITQIGEKEKIQEVRLEVEKKVDELENVKLGTEHGIKELLLSTDFWLYFLVYTCTITLVMVYETNLGQISKSRGRHEASVLLALSSTFGFFGRVFSVSFDWYARENKKMSRAALMVIMTIPMPLSFFLLTTNNNICLHISTCVLGTCAGVMISISGSITSQLFGRMNTFVNHNVIVINVPIGSLLFGYLEALNYERESGGGDKICMGFNCHHKSFIMWGTISFLGTLLGFILYLRTRILFSRK